MNFVPGTANGFVLDGLANLARSHLAASDISGGGPIKDLRDLGLGAGWRGDAAVHIVELTADLSAAGAALASAAGDITVSDVSCMQVASGANLGGYHLHFQPAQASGAGMSAVLADTGGPLAVNATIHLSMTARSGLFSGTVKERPDASPELRSELDNLAQLHARDSQGRLPVDLEFTF